MDLKYNLKNKIIRELTQQYYVINRDNNSKSFDIPKYNTA